MKNLNEYEPTTTDELLLKNATSENTLWEDYSALAAHAVRIERKLAACRDALGIYADRENHPTSQVDGYLLAQQTLAATAP